jgi:hypothetical protein
VSERIRERLNELDSLRSGVPFDPEAFGERLESAFDEALRHLTGDDHRDIEGVDGALDEGRSGFRFEGHGPEGTRRFWCVIYYEVQPARLTLNIAVTKGQQGASLDCFGESGPEYGNRPLVARAFDVLLATAIEGGVRHLENSPWDDRVRDIYTAMGFENGERFDLSSSDQLRRGVHRGRVRPRGEGP